MPAHAVAACPADALGTSRTIRIDPAKRSLYVGHEKALGLRHKEVVLTFDDGPIAGKTPRVLAALKAECVKATFFAVGKMARSHPKLVRRIVSQGHTLAHHTWDHNRLPTYSRSEAGKHVDRGIAVVEKIAYGEASDRARVPFFRYPYLSRNKKTDALLKSRGLVAFDANIDALDWKKVSAGAVHDRIMRRLRKEGRGIILMHDIQSRTAKMLPRLLDTLHSEGYTVVHLVPGGSAHPAPKPAHDPVVVASVAPTSLPPLPQIGEPVSASVSAADRTRRTGIVRARADTTADRRRQRKTKRLERTFQIASVRRSKARDLVVNKRWRLRRSQWIIN